MSKSSERVSKVLETVSEETGCTDLTPKVDWTVKAVGQERQKQPWAAAVLMSAVTPAPEEGSKPAIDKTTLGCELTLES